MRGLTRSDTLLLLELNLLGGRLFIYTLHRKYRLSPAEIARSIRKLQIMKVVKSDGSNIELTKNGKNWMTKHRFQLFSPEEKPWRNCPNEFMQQKIGVDKPYIPKISKLDKSFGLNE